MTDSSIGVGYVSKKDRRQDWGEWESVRGVRKMIETVGNRKEATTKTNRERGRGLWRRGGRGVRRGLSTAGSLDVWTLFGPISLSEGFAPGEMQQRVWAE